MTITWRLLSLFLMIISVSPVFALSPEMAELRSRMARGFRATDSDVALVNSELAKTPDQVETRLTAGEVLASRGFYALANDQYASADKIKPDYVLNQFKQIFPVDRFSAALMFLYLQDKYPDDPALLYYAALRNLSATTYSQEAKDKAITTARKELNKAMALPNPWPGTFATFAMMEYNNNNDDLASTLVEKELHRNPKEPMALRLRALIATKHGKRPGDIVPDIEAALKVVPMDDQMNLLLGRALLAKKNYAAAVRPALLGLYWQHDPQTLSDARHQVFELIQHADRKQVLAVVKELSDSLSDPGSNGAGFRSTVFRMRVAELFSTYGDKVEACEQLLAAYGMHPNFHAAAAYRMGRELVSMHEYHRAYVYLEEAVRSNMNPHDDEKYRAFKRRVARVGVNSERDLAFKLKMLFRKKSQAMPASKAQN